MTLITYCINNKVNILGVIEGRGKTDITVFLSKIPACLRKTTQAICCDLYDVYMNACKKVLNKKIEIVADRFHVRKLYRKRLINLIKSELSQLITNLQ